MRSLELPAGSVLIMSKGCPDGVYALRKGLIGMFDRLDRLMIVIYQGESFGYEAMYGLSAMYTTKSLTFVEVDLYEPSEYRERLDGGAKKKVLKTVARWEWLVHKRYALKTEDRMKDILRELKDMDVSEAAMNQILVSLDINDALAFEKLRGEMM